MPWYTVGNIRIIVLWKQTRSSGNKSFIFDSTALKIISCRIGYKQLGNVYISLLIITTVYQTLKPIILLEMSQISLHLIVNTTYANNIDYLFSDVT